jgi:hypothetical protein
MSDIEKNPFEITKIDKLPEGARQISGVYDNIISEILKKENGSYLVELKGRKSQTLYQQLYKHLKGKEGLKLHRLADKVYIVKEVTIPKRK